MQKTKLIFLRHADTQKDPAVNVAFWVLSELGKRQAEEISKLSIMNEVEEMYVSEEEKTTLTALPLAKKLAKQVHPLSFFNEVKRGDAFLTKEEFEVEKKKQLLDLNHQAFGGESGNEALARFKQGVAQVVQQNQGKTILIVTHGTILNIYFADLLQVFEQLPERWQKTAFCAYGCTEDGVVTKDIVSVQMPNL